MIAAARRESGLSRFAVAKAIGTTTAVLRRYENGMDRIGPGRLVALADVLDRPLAYFFGAKSDHVAQVLHRAFVVSSHDDRNGSWKHDAEDLLKRMEVIK